MLDVRDVHLSFGGIKALQGISFSARAGEITGVIGPNGAGKTSLFNAISGFYRPDRGQVFFGERDITALSPDKRAELGIARTFQNIALFRGMTVLDNIKLGAHTRSRTGLWSALRYFGPAQREELTLRREIEERVIDFLEIDHIRKYPITMLPYGLQKRVELGRALAMQPQLLLLDEPVAGMNREETADMARFILDVQEQFGTTILLVEHDMHMVMDICSHIVVLNFGRQIAEGTPAEVSADNDVIEAYLGAAA
ncbi:ABC transporter ATP-binding protein [Roseitalea porphyridii]|uniref:ABC transporter ATP-binding protein n=1 Tax=Roseitalea porphyridii TaxID=1852022 RepID=A0A4V1A3H4_9HYPH|nr:ABC transporter ATP-binding protein [Roseitalea porphyridii]QBK29128.1 ABC transporter ATP-binding protein [Roseitalea porphyridii]